MTTRAGSTPSSSKIRSWASPTSDSTAWVVMARPVRRAARAAARWTRSSAGDTHGLSVPISPMMPGRTPVSPTPSVDLPDELVGEIVDRTPIDQRLGRVVGGPVPAAAHDDVEAAGARPASRSQSRITPDARQGQVHQPASAGVAEPGELVEDDRLVARQLPVIPARLDVPQRDLGVLVRQGEPERVGLDRAEDGLDVGHATAMLRGRGRLGSDRTAAGRPVVAAPMPYRRRMRLILDAKIRPETVERLRAMDGLEVVDLSADDGFDPRTLADSEVEILIAGRPPADLSRVPHLRWLQVPSAGVDHMAADPPWQKGLLVTNARGVYAVPIGEYVTGMVLRVHQPAATWSADQAAHRWPPGDPRLVTLIRGRTAVIAGYGSIGREVARQLSALGMRIIAVKARPEDRHDPSFRVPGTGDPDGSIPGADRRRRGAPEVAREADVLVVTMPLTEESRGIVGARGDRRAARARLAHQHLARPAGRRTGPARGAARGRLAGAVLDVFGQEPLPPDSPWWDAPNVIVTPHASGHTLRFLDELVVENVRRYLAGEPLLNQVDPERGY